MNFAVASEIVCVYLERDFVEAEILGAVLVFRESGCRWYLSYSFDLVEKDSLDR
jgi:hypothetical protein